jgi:hypothetical protein
MQHGKQSKPKFVGARLEGIALAFHALHIDY